MGRVFYGGYRSQFVCGVSLTEASQFLGTVFEAGDCSQFCFHVSSISTAVASSFVALLKQDWTVAILLPRFFDIDGRVFDVAVDNSFVVFFEKGGRRQFVRRASSTEATIADAFASFAFCVLSVDPK